MNQRHETADREVRIRLTSLCNYACTFCHREGGSGYGRSVPTFDDLRPLLEAFHARGRRDFTLTGGEPLLNRATVLDALAWFAQAPDQPSVTLVTNGALMDDAVSNALAACPAARVNLSLHSTDAAAYHAITGQVAVSPAALVDRFRSLTDRGVGLKVNAVLLRASVEQSGWLEGLLGYAEQAGASHVKLIELLVTREHPELRAHHVPVEWMEERLRTRATMLSDATRMQTYRWNGSGVQVELTRCACRLGCTTCAEVRADVLAACDRYQPCFLSPATWQVSPATLAATLRRADRHVQRMAANNGAYAPMLLA